MDRICVFCGSNRGARPEYGEAARELGQVFAARGITLVYGGGRVGLMGTLADAVLAAGGKAIGVIPQALVEREVAHQGLTELVVVRSMHERKARMAELAQAFIALPGGYGTLEEFCEVLTWSQLGLHAKPCGLLNVRGYYDALLAFLDHSTVEGFVRAEQRGLVLEARRPAELLERLAQQRSHPLGKWIEP